MTKLILSAFLGCLILSCASSRQLKKDGMHVQIIPFEDLPFLDEKLNIRLGGFSSLQFLKEQDQKLLFRTITDRGPNLDEIKLEHDGEVLNARPFLIPDYTPSIIDFSFNPQNLKIEILKRNELMGSDGQKAKGLPPKNLVAAKNETAITLNNEILENAELGMDPEGYTQFKNFHIVSDEYGPGLYVFDSKFKLTKSYTADDELPEELKLRKINRGFEALAADNEYVYVMLQSPLIGDQNNVRIIQFDVIKGKVQKQFFYPLQIQLADNIGDMAFSSDLKKLFVLEQNGKLGAEKGVRRIFSVDLSSADSNGNLKKELVADLVQLGINQFEKIEGLTVINSKQLALVVDNDFGLDGGFNPTNQTYKTKEDPKPYFILLQSDKSVF